MKTYVALAALMTAFATPAAAQQVVAAPMAMPTTTEGFRQMAMMSDQFEIQSSRLALERSRNPRVRRYAQMMIRDHSLTSQALMGGPGAMAGMGTGTTSGAVGGAIVGGVVGGPIGAAVGAGVGATAGAATGAAAEVTGAVAVPMMPLDARHAAMLNDLAAANGRQFDALYAQMQVMSHQEAVALFSGYAQSGANPALAQFAREALPHLQGHLAMAQGLPGARAAMVR